jgi:hypothetical protein
MAWKGVIGFAVVLAAMLGTRSGALAAGEPRIAFFGFNLLNTSLEPTRPDEARRVQELDDLLRSRLEASGRFTLVPLPPDVKEAAASGPAVGSCNGCERGLAERARADWAAWGTVQKVSNLILNINLYMEDARTGTMEFVKSVDIRGNTDESWRHGLDYLLRHYLFGEP